MTATDKNEDISYEQAMIELKQLVEMMEKGSMSLDENLKAYERGTLLVKICGDHLKNAEQKVTQLSNADDVSSDGDN